MSDQQFDDTGVTGAGGQPGPPGPAVVAARPRPEDRRRLHRAVPPPSPPRPPPHTRPPSATRPRTRTHTQAEHVNAAQDKELGAFQLQKPAAGVPGKFVRLDTNTPASLPPVPPVLPKASSEARISCGEAAATATSARGVSDPPKYLVRATQRGGS